MATYKLSDSNNNIIALLGLLTRHSSLTQPRLLFHLPDSDRIRRNRFPDSWGCRHWGHLPTNGKSHSNGMVPLRDTHRPSVRTFPRWNYRHVQILESNLLPTDSTCWRGNSWGLLPPPRNSTPYESRRSRRSPAAKES